MDNQQVVSEVQPSNSNPRSGGLLKVKQLDPTTMKGDEMTAFWEKIKTQDYAFDDTTRNDPSAFVLNLVAPASTHFVANDSIYIICRNVWKNSNVDMHLVIYDRNFHFKDVVEAGRQVLEWLFKEKQVARVSGFIPKFNPIAARFATTAGFKYEGTMRQAVLYHEQFHDVDLYGILPKEFERRFHQ